MRKTQKDSVLEIINLLKQVQEHIKNLLRKQEYASVLDLLQQCQQGAIQVGNIIEESEGEETATVKLLEEYCELVFQLFETVQGSTAETKNLNEEAAVLKMERLLEEVEGDVRKKIKIRKEVVFLPYKASMWDSLESVWKAADEDPECDAYVIPIPYFDKNPDGSVKEMHYEGDLYPEDVPITDYNSYDFASRRPDMIYIHNPYDEANFVTSVHPFFYSKNLKQYTDCLVYIPYFVLGEPNPEDEEAEKGIEHFVMVPGVIHAHRVIVQSENMRQMYINIMTKRTGEKTRNYWEKKISGEGSPKFDRLRCISKENLKLPQNWLDVIQKEDGTWKKIIFYNTSVGALLEHGSDMIRKIDDVLRVFKENKEEVVLLWRPHPLIKATIEAMRPQLWREYSRIVETYKEEGWGIYDDTPDLDRAIIMCDAYYGDLSSVVQLCQKAEKMIMLQNVKQNCFT